MNSLENEDNTGSPVDVKSAMVAMREAARMIEREESMDAVEALTSAAQQIAIEKHEELVSQAADDPLAVAALEVMPAEMPVNSRRESTNAAAQFVMQQMQDENIMPKASESIGIEEDVNALLGIMKESTAKNPISARYLKMLELQKRGEKSPSRNRKGKSKNSTELSRLSQLLRDMEGTHMLDRVSQSTFKNYNQEMLYKSMRKVASRPSSAPAKRVNGRNAGHSNYYDRLYPSRQSELDLNGALRRAHTKDKTMVYSSYSDAKNCTFRPRTNESRRKAQQAVDTDEAEAKHTDNFLSRQEAKHRARLDDLEFNMGKKDYEALVDKRYCPSCGAKQSYDEVKEKRKRCPNCNVEYRRKISWGDVGSDFYKRQSKASAQYHKKQEELRKSLRQKEMVVRRKRVDAKTGKLIVEDVSVTSSNLKWTPAMEEEFLSRQDYWEEVRRRDVEKAELEMYGRHRLQSQSASRSHHGDDSFLDFAEDAAASTRSSGLKWTTQMEQDFLSRQEHWEEVRQRDIERVEYEMYGRFQSQDRRARRRRDRSDYKDSNEETFAEYLYHS